MDNLFLGGIQNRTTVSASINYRQKDLNVLYDKPFKVERPEFGMGRIDLANGDYLVNTRTTIYESTDEAKEDLIKHLEI